MSIFSKANIDTKIFIGASLSTEIRIALSQSEKWQLALAGRSENETELSITRHFGEEYLGFFFPKRMLKVKELQEGKKIFQDKLFDYCPSINTAALKKVSFAQVFIK